MNLYDLEADCELPGHAGYVARLRLLRAILPATAAAIARRYPSIFDASGSHKSNPCGRRRLNRMLIAAGAESTWTRRTGKAGIWAVKAGPWTPPRRETRSPKQRAAYAKKREHWSEWRRQQDEERRVFQERLDRYTAPERPNRYSDRPPARTA